ncbi:MAG: hypothetical protein P4L81_01510 [Candidatus Pacebacteria bacterium]|nr:hypothetical protein [Candidatus Paceibacterota bacterium]
MASKGKSPGRRPKSGLRRIMQKFERMARVAAFDSGQRTPKIRHDHASTR